MIRNRFIKSTPSLSAAALPLALALAAFSAPALAADHGAHDHKKHDHENHDTGDVHDNHGDHGDHGDHSKHEGHDADDGVPTEVSLSLTPAIETALASGGEPVVVEVLGVVCDFCAKAMNKTFGKRDEVSAVYVDLDHKTLNLVLNSGAALPDKELNRLVKRAGYKIKAIHRGQHLVRGPHASDPA